MNESDVYVKIQSKKLISKNEGLSLKCYKDISGHNTIGYGRNLDERGITQQEADKLLDNDVEYFMETLNFNDTFINLSDNRKIAIIDMAFNMGIKSVYSFKKMWDALALKDYHLAAAEIKNSIYAKLLPHRAEHNANIILFDKLNYAGVF